MTCDCMSRKAYAFCENEACMVTALEYLKSATVFVGKIVHVEGITSLHYCACGNRAAWYLREPLTAG